MILVTGHERQKGHSLALNGHGLWLTYVFINNEKLSRLSQKTHGSSNMLWQPIRIALGWKTIKMEVKDTLINGTDKEVSFYY